MTATSLSAAEALYECAASRTIAYHTVGHTTFQRLCAAGRRLERAAGERADDVLLGPILKDARRLRFELSTVPLAFNDPHVLARLSGANYRNIASKIRLVYPAIADDSEEVVGLLTDILVNGENPLLIGAHNV